jgi:hypothetical protein
MYLSNISREEVVVNSLVLLKATKTIITPSEAVFASDNNLSPESGKLVALRKAVESVLTQPTALDQLVEVFGKGAPGFVNGKSVNRPYNLSADFHFLASVFANVSQVCQKFVLHMYCSN